MFERLLNLTWHVKVWISFTQFEGSEIGKGLESVCSIFERAHNQLKSEGLKEGRVLLLDAWRVYKKSKGSVSQGICCGSQKYLVVLNMSECAKTQKVLSLDGKNNLIIIFLTTREQHQVMP